MGYTLFDTKTLTYREIVGNGKRYIIPRFQRDYAWTEDNWEDLWFDILELRNSNNSQALHYMGSIVLQETKEDRQFYIIDGQQRLVTISLLILACLKLIRAFPEKEDREREDLIRNTYLGNKDGISLNYTSKLVLNKNNNDFYTTYLNQLREPFSRNSLNHSEQLLWDSYTYFYQQLEKQDFSKSSKELYKFIDTIIGDKILFIQITVADELSAYTVFETLNARRLELTTSDLLKNYLFSLLKSNLDIEQAETLWSRITGVIGLKKIPQFLRYYYNAYHPIIREERLFKELRNHIKTDIDVFKLLEELQKHAELYIALGDPDHELWKEQKEIRDLIEELVLFNTQQQKSLLLAAYFLFFESDPKEFIKTLRIIRSIIFRYTIIGGLNPNELEKRYNEGAIAISERKIRRAQDLIEYLKPIYPEDEEFKQFFTTKQFDVTNSRQKKIIRYILICIENQKFNKSYNPFSTDITLEHIMPQNPQNQWGNITSEELMNGVNRLGNITLLESKLNSKDASNNDFNIKKEIYMRSEFGITNTIYNQYNIWGIEEIRQRQKSMAEIASAVWKI